MAAFADRPKPKGSPGGTELLKTGEIYTCGPFVAVVDYANGTAVLSHDGARLTVPIDGLQRFARFAVSVAYKGGAKDAQ